MEPALKHIFIMAIIIGLIAPVGAFAEETVNFTAPAGVSFYVFDVSSSTTGNPDPFTISFTDSSIIASHALRVSVKADAASFTAPSGTAIPASSVSWNAGGAQGGTGSGGTLSSISYVQIYQSNTNPATGSVDLTWSLAPLPSGVRAGDHTLTVRWKVESVIP